MSTPLGKGTLSGGIMNLNVGTPETPFDVHLELLCDSSPYFNNLFLDRFVKVPLASVRLPDDDPNTFTEFLNWLYRGKIFQSQVQPPMIELSRLWVLADKFEVPELQNLVTMHLKKKFYHQKNSLPETSTINYIYSNTKPGSTLRQMVVDMFAQRVTQPKFLRCKKEVPRIFLEDLSDFWIEKRDSIDPNIDVSPFFESLYFVPVQDRYASMKPRRDDEPEMVRLATSDAMENRNIKTPVSRKRSSRATSSTSIDTPSSTSTDARREGDILQELNDLKI